MALIGTPSGFSHEGSMHGHCTAGAVKRAEDYPEGDFRRVADAVTEMQHIPFYIDQTGGISIAQLTARARRLKRQKGLDLLVIDYLQLLSGSKTRSAAKMSMSVVEDDTHSRMVMKPQISVSASNGAVEKSTPLPSAS